VIQEHQIFPGELVLLALWLCAPALIVALAAQSIFLWRRGLFRNGRALSALSGLVGTIVGTVVVAVPLWVFLPLRALPPSVIPEHGQVLPPLFLPGYMAAAGVAAGVAWLMSKAQPAVAADGDALRAPRR